MLQKIHTQTHTLSYPLNSNSDRQGPPQVLLYAVCVSLDGSNTCRGVEGVWSGLLTAGEEGAVAGTISSCSGVSTSAAATAAAAEDVGASSAGAKVPFPSSAAP